MIPVRVDQGKNTRSAADFIKRSHRGLHRMLTRFRILNIVDDVTRECLAAIPDTSIPGQRVARELDGADRLPQQAWHDRLGQRHRVHLQRKHPPKAADPLCLFDRNGALGGAPAR
jgi:hypothetical protein